MSHLSTQMYGNHKILSLFKDVLELLPAGALIVENNNVMFINTKLKAIINTESCDDSETFTKFKSIIEGHNDDIEYKIQYENKHLLVMKKDMNHLNVFVVTDITDARKLQFVEMEEKFKGRLMMMFTHEFKTPLNWISGILSSLIPSESTKKLLKMAKHAVGLLNLYIEDVIFFNQAQNQKNYAMENKKFSVSKCINECISFTSSEASMNQIQCNAFTPSSIPTYITGDPLRYKQILNNILCNSIKSCAPVTGNINISVNIDDAKLYTTVSDNGKLLSSDEVSLLMNPCSNIDTQTLQFRFGIGMMFCRMMCQKCGGDLTISSENNLNKYKFWIPIQSIDETSKQDYRKQESTFDLSRDNLRVNSNVESFFANEIQFQPQIDQSRKILVVDDTAFNNTMIKYMLRLLNVDCDCCLNGIEALNMIKAKNNYSMVFMDVNMPEMDGIQTTFEIKKWQKDNKLASVPIVMLSAQDDMKVVNEALKAGAVEYCMQLT